VVIDTRLQSELLALLSESDSAMAAMSDGLRHSPEDPGVDGVVAELRRVADHISRRLGAVVDAHGWPGVSLVGEAGTKAAYRLVAHALALPEFQRSMLPRIERAAAAGEASWGDAAHLEDRIRAMEGRPQKYGTLLSPDQAGQMMPHPPIESPEMVDALRAKIGLCTVEEEARARRDALTRRGAVPSADEIAKQRRDAERWAVLLGWRVLE
jgi:hypothetical protein